VILGCGALRADTIGTVRHQAGLRELHFSVQVQVPSLMRYRHFGLTMGGAPAEREFYHVGTDPDLVRATIAAARA
jgi:copper homeostasis protein